MLLSDAFAKVNRKDFVPAITPVNFTGDTYIYGDEIVPIDPGKSTMSQPTLVAKMLAESQITSIVMQRRRFSLRRQKAVRMLEIGAASGYSAAVAASIDTQHIHVDTVEIDPRLVEHAKSKLQKYPNVHVYQAEMGQLGVPFSLRAEGEKYDTIIATVGFPVLPQQLLEQLAENGTCVVPVKDYIVIATKKRNTVSLRIDTQNMVRFVDIQGMTKVEGKPIDIKDI